eukprot:Skav234940  [mRNA]  locus=scaffold2677:203191:217779:+ [translate_table: standard]
MQAPNGGWWCPKHACGAQNGMHANYCNQCGTHWQYVPKQKKPPRKDTKKDATPAAEWWDQPWGDSQPSAAPPPKSPGRSRRPSRRERERAKKEKDKEKAKADSGDAPVVPSPFTTYAPNTFQLPQAAATPFQTPVTPQAVGVNQELVAALRAAYPDSATVPQSVKDLLEKAKEDTTKVLTKSLHQATAALGRSKKLHNELLEVRKVHRSNWLKHLAAAASQWTQQLEDYRRKQMEYQDSINKAAKDIALARRQILQLNLSEAGVEMPQLQEEVEPVADSLQDKEEHVLRQELQNALQACADSVGPINLDAALLTDLEQMEDSEEERRKRSRSEASSAPHAPAAPAPVVIEAYHAQVHVHGAASHPRKHGIPTEAARLLHVHSVMDEGDYLSPWDAQLRAITLHWELHGDSVQYNVPTASDFVHPNRLTPRPLQSVLHSGCGEHENFPCTHSSICSDFDDLCVEIRDVAPLSPVAVLSSSTPLTHATVICEGMVGNSSQVVPLDDYGCTDGHLDPRCKLGLHVHRIQVDAGVTEPDDFSVMQGSLAVRQDPRIDVALFRRGHTMIHAKATRHPLPARFRDVAASLHLSHDDIAEVFDVHRPLPGLDASRLPWLVLTNDDPFDASRDCLILCDVVLYAGGPDNGALPRRVRKARICPARVSRDDVLMVARAYEACVYLRDRCLVAHNGRPWNVQDQHLRRLASGDWLEITVPPQEPSPTGDVCADVIAAHPPDSDAPTEGDLDNQSDWVSDGADGEGPADPPHGGVADLHEQEFVFCVWAIHHVHQRACPGPRVVVTSVWPDAWSRDLLAVWNDVLHAASPTSFHLVVPQPGNAVLPDGRRCLHVLLEQGLNQARRAVLVSVSVRVGQRRSGEVMAHSVPAYISGAILANAVGVAQDEVTRHEVTVRMHHRFLDWADIVPASAGTNYQLAIRARADTLVTDGDAGSLMQINRGASPALEEEIPNVLQMSPPIDSVGAASVDLAGWSSVFHCAATDALLPLPPSLHELLFLWTRHAMVEAVQEGPIAYASVWYIHHISTQQCLLSRSVRLGSLFQEWVPTLIQAWADHFHWSEPYRIHIVRPSPPNSPLQSTTVHVLIEQGLQSTNVPVLLCRLAAEILHPGCERLWAFSSPVEVTGSSLLRQAYPQAPNVVLDDVGLCEVIVRARAISPRESCRVRAADLVVTRNLAGAPQIVHAIDGTAPSNGGIQNFVDLGLQTTFHVSPLVAHLARAFDRVQIVAEGMNPVLRVRTWFLDHLRLPEFPVYREMTLTLPWLTWYQQLVAVWRDLIDPAILVEVSMVRPAPFERMSDRDVVDVIIWQRALPGRKVGLVRVNQQRLYALCLPQEQSRAGLLRAVGMSATCRHLSCVVQHGPLSVTDDMHFHICDGFGFTVDVQQTDHEDSSTAHGAHSSHAQDVDMVTLMQTGAGTDSTSASVSSGPSYRPVRHRHFVTYLEAHRLLATGSCSGSERSDATIHTYFLCGRRMTTCQVARLVTIGHDPAEWIEQILDAWEDWYVPADPVSFYLVYPLPVRVGASPLSAATVLIVQNEPDHLRAAFTTVLHLDASLVHAARFLPASVTRAAVIDEVGLTAFDDPPCTVVHADSVLRDDVAWDVYNGQGLYIGIIDGRSASAAAPAVPSGPTPTVLVLDTLIPEPWLAPDSSDESAVMQLPVRVDTAKLEPCHDGNVPLQERSDNNWDDFDVLWDYQCPSVLRLQVWFIHHLHHTQCVSPRRLVLTPAVDDWRQAIERVWSDMLFPGEPTFISMVHMTQTRLVGRDTHVILWQHPCIDKVVALHVVTWDPSLERAPLLRAMSCARTMRARAILNLVEAEWQLHPLLLRYLFFRVQPHLFVALTDGSTWTVEVSPPQVSDAVSLLQTKPACVRPLSKVASKADVEDEVGPGRTKLVACPGILALSEQILHSGLRLHSPETLPELLRFSEYEHDLSMVSGCLPALHPTRIHIYTDGSHLWNALLCDARAAWAFVVVYEYSNGQLLLAGYDHAPVAGRNQTHSLAVIYEETPFSNAFTAEAEAIVRAILWCLQSEVYLANIPTILHADAASVLYAADGHWTCGSRAFVRDVCRPLFIAAQQLGDLTAQWQKAHCHHCFNDLVDVLAKQAARATVARPSPFPFDDSQVPLLPWLWLAFQSQVDNVGVHVQPDAIAFPVPPVLGAADVATWPQHALRERANLHLNLTYATFNVETLKQWHQSDGAGTWTSRGELLRVQGAQHHFMCIQEARGKKDSTWTKGDWFGFGAAAVQGSGGCEIWFNKAIPFAFTTDLHGRRVPLFFEQLVPPVRFSRAALLSDEGRASAACMLRDFEKGWKDHMWHMSIDQHAADMHHFFAKHLTETFPVIRAKPKPSWLSLRTVQALCLSRRARRAIALCHKHVQVGTARHLFAAWASVTPFRRRTRPVPPSPPDPQWASRCDFAIARYQQWLGQLHRVLRASLRADEGVFLRGVVAEEEKRSGAASGSALWHCIRSKLPKFRQRRRMLVTKYQLTPQALQNHFANVEKATVLPLQQVASQIVSCNRVALSAMHEVEVDHTELPTLVELEEAIRSVPKHKAMLGVAQRSAVTANLLGIDTYDEEECRVSAVHYPSALHDLHASSLMQRWVQQILSCTWSQVQAGSQHLTDSHALFASTGTRPGDPGADLFFTATMAGGFKRAKCKRALVASAQFRTTGAQRLLLEKACGASDWTSGPQDLPPVTSSAPQFWCSVCEKGFDSGTALAAHKTLQHGHTASVRAWMPDPVECGSCLKRFGCTQKLRQHLQYSRGKCLRHLQAVWWPLTDEDIRAVETVPMKVERSQYRVPALQGCGPWLPTAAQWREAAPHRRWPAFSADALPPVGLTLGDCLAWYRDEESPFSTLISQATLPPDVAEDFLDVITALPPADRAGDHDFKLACWYKAMGSEVVPPGTTSTSPRVSACVSPAAAVAPVVLILHDGARCAELDLLLLEVSSQYQLPLRPIFVHVDELQLTQGIAAECACKPWIDMMAEGELFAVLGLFTSSTWWTTGARALRDDSAPWGVAALSAARAARVRSANACACVWTLLARRAQSHGLVSVSLGRCKGSSPSILGGVWQFPPIATFAQNTEWTQTCMTLIDRMSDMVHDFSVLHQGLVSLEVCWWLCDLRLHDPAWRPGPIPPSLHIVTRTGSVPFNLAVNAVTPMRCSQLCEAAAQLNGTATELILLARRWAKDRGISHAAKGHLSPYAWTLLAMYYLQDQSLFVDFFNFYASVFRWGFSE